VSEKNKQNLGNAKLIRALDNARSHFHNCRKVTHFAG